MEENLREYVEEILADSELDEVEKQLAIEALAYNYSLTDDEALQLDAFINSKIKKAR